MPPNSKRMSRAQARQGALHEPKRQTGQAPLVSPRVARRLHAEVRRARVPRRATDSCLFGFDTIWLQSAWTATVLEGVLLDD
jgi:hypothetical protein